MSINISLRSWARRIKGDVVMLWFARSHPETPLLAKILCVAAVLYALSPVDLIPDFIPVLGYVDDVLLLPALIWLAVRLLPHDVVAACRVQANDWIAARNAKPTSYVGAVLIAIIWCIALYFCWQWIIKTTGFRLS